MSKELLEINDLYVNAGEKEILKGINLKINKGEIHVIMGPNGSGKTTTANAILNNPAYHKENGSIIFEGENITNLKTDEIARKGIFMSFQLPLIFHIFRKLHLKPHLLVLRVLVLLQPFPLLL